MIKLNPKYKDYITSDCRYFVITGGRGSGKSFAITLLNALRSKEPGHKTLYTRYTMNSAHDSIIPEFQAKIDLLQLEHEFKINKNQMIHADGSEILFRGIKTSSGVQTAKLKSLEGITDWVLDEAEELTDEETFDKINLSVRGKGAQNRVTLILNPTTKEHWIYKRFFEDRGVPDGFTGIKGDTCYIHTTYLDNIANLPQSFLDEVEIMKQRRPKKYAHQILGGWLNKAEGVIFEEYSIEPFPNVDAVYGMDFGFSIDPSTLIATHIDKKQKRVYLKEHLYKPKLTTSELANIAKSVCGKSLIVADSAEPRLITELASKGLNIVEAVKGQGSVTGGIGLMLDYDICIDPDSINLIKEFNNYCWLDKGKIQPVDDFNHAIDAARYSVMYQLANPNKGKYHVY